MLDETAAVSYTHAWIGEVHDEPVSCLICHEPSEVPTLPDDYIPEMFKPVLILENRALSTGNVFILSTSEEFQGQGIGSRMLEFAQWYAGLNGMSLLINDANVRARALYERHGYVVTSSEAMVKKEWENPGQNWLLMVKGLEG